MCLYLISDDESISVGKSAIFKKRDSISACDSNEGLFFSAWYIQETFCKVVWRHGISVPLPYFLDSGIIVIPTLVT